MSPKYQLVRKLENFCHYPIFIHYYAQGLYNFSKAIKVHQKGNLILFKYFQCLFLSQALLSDQPCILDELEVEYSEMFPTLKEAASWEVTSV